MNRTNICCQSKKGPVSVKDGLQPVVLKMRFLDKKHQVTWEFVGNTDSGARPRPPESESLWVGLGYLCSNRQILGVRLRTTALYTLSYLILITALGTKCYTLFPSSQMGKLRVSRH